jgi:hypothetical protein
MLFKVFPKGRCGLNYVLGIGRKDDPRRPSVIAGNSPDEVGAIIKGLTFKNPFTSLALSYERRLTVAEAQRDIAGFEAALLPGLDTTAWARVWIRHEGTALHCIIANIHLPTGRRLQPYYHFADRKRMKAWQEATNHAHGYASPKDPARQRAFFIGARLPKSVAELKTALTEGATASLARGEITSRENLLEWFCAQGFEIARVTAKSISLKHHELKRNLRLQGAIYEHDGINRAREGSQPSPREGTHFSDENLAKYRRDLEQGIAKRRAELHRQFESHMRGGDATHRGGARETPETRTADGFAAGTDNTASIRGHLFLGAQNPTDAPARPGNTLGDKDSDDNKAQGGDHSDGQREHLLRSILSERTTDLESNQNKRAGVTNHDHAGTNQANRERKHNTAESLPDGDRAFAIFAGIRGRTIKAFQRVGMLVAKFAHGLQQSRGGPPDDGDTIPSIGIRGAAVASIGRLICREFNRRQRITEERATLFQAHDAILRQRERERERPGPMPSL